MLKVFLICIHGQFIGFLNAKYPHPDSFIFFLFHCCEHLSLSFIMLQQEVDQPFYTFGGNMFSACSVFAAARNASSPQSRAVPSWDSTSRGTALLQEPSSSALCKQGTETCLCPVVVVTSPSL